MYTHTHTQTHRQALPLFTHNVNNGNACLIFNFIISSPVCDLETVLGKIFQGMCQFHKRKWRREVACLGAKNKTLSFFGIQDF